jgi:ferredoxin
MPRGDGTGPPPGAGARAGRRGRGTPRGSGGRRGQGQGRRRRRRGNGKLQRTKLAVFPTQTSRARRLAVEWGRGGAPPLGQRDLLVKGREESLRAVRAVPLVCIDEEACTLCGACQVACPTEAISLGERAVEVNMEACCGCGACVDACPNGAIRLK